MFHKTYFDNQYVVGGGGGGGGAGGAYRVNAHCYDPAIVLGKDFTYMLEIFFYLFKGYVSKSASNILIISIFIKNIKWIPTVWSQHMEFLTDFPITFQYSNEQNQYCHFCAIILT